MEKIGGIWVATHEIACISHDSTANMVEEGPEEEREETDEKDTGKKTKSRKRKLFE